MLRSPSEVEVRELLLSSGVRFSDKGDYYSIFCPFHHNTKTASAALYKDKWLFKCFGCGAVYSFYKLYRALKGKPWNEHGSFGMVPLPVKDTLSRDYREAFAIEEGLVTGVYDNARALEYCRSRGVSDEFMRFFNFKATDICKFKRVEKSDQVSI